MADAMDRFVPEERSISVKVQNEAECERLEVTRVFALEQEAV